ncbi:MAG: SPOR domain-containing protein [Rhodospirillales bacterium]|nr:SPOR domain-containing protein [Rhodospirillales bacterium]
MVPSDEQGEEIVPDPSDALEFEAVKRVKPKRRGLWLFLLLLVVSGGAGAGWHFYGDMLFRGEGDNVPVIRAAEGPVKVRPKNPGGMSVPDRDKLVYDRMKGGVEEPRVERLLPPPEMPKTPPVPAPALQPEAKIAQAVPVAENPKLLSKPQKLEPGKVELKKPVEKKVEPAKKEEPAVTINHDMMPKEQVAAPATTPEPAVTPTPSSQQTASSVLGLAYQIQIAAVRTAERANSEWERLKKKHSDLLGGYSLNVVRADLGPDKGIFFRLRAGPIAGEDVAKALCENLSNRKVGCLIVRPGG